MTECVMRRVACLVVLLFTVCVSPVYGQESSGPPNWLTNATIGAGVTLGFVEIVASESCLQRGTCYEANRILPGGITKGDTVGRALLKGSGTAAASYLLLRAKRRHKWAALAGGVGLIAWNGYLTKRALDRFPPGGGR